MKSHPLEMNVNYACCGGGCCGAPAPADDKSCCGGNDPGCCGDDHGPKEVRIASTKDLIEGQVKGMEIDGKKVALVRQGGKFYALDGACSHKGGPLGKGLLKEGVLICPWHGAEFRLADGAAVKAPADKAVKTFSVEVRGEDIFIKI